MLQILIALEALFIVSAYWNKIGFAVLIPAGVYCALAIADWKLNQDRKDLRFSFLVLIVSIGISVPRLFFQYEELRDKRAGEIIQKKGNQILPPEYIPAIQDCKLIAYWEPAKTEKCQNENRAEQKKQNDSIMARTRAQMSSQEETQDEAENVNITVSDWGLFFLYMCLSVSLPAGIYLLIHAPAPREPDSEYIPISEPVAETPVELTPDEKLLKSLEGLDDLVKTRILAEHGWNWHRIRPNVSISRATFFRLKREWNKPVETNVRPLLKIVNGGLVDGHDQKTD